MPAPAKDTGGALAGCLTGTWEYADLRGYLQQVLTATGAGAGAGAELVDATGNARTTFRPDGVAAGNIDTSASVRIGGGPTATVRLNGESQARYRVEAGQLIFSESILDNVTMAISIAGIAVVPPQRITTFIPEGSTVARWTVTCSGTTATLALIEPAGTNLPPVQLRKVS